MRFRKTLTLLILATGLAFALPAWAQQKPVAPGGTSPGIAANPTKPFTQEQVSNMVRDGIGDESGAKLIEQGGIDFPPADDFTLRAASAAGHHEKGERRHQNQNSP